MPWTPLEGHVPMQHAMLVTCMQAQAMKDTVQ